MALYKPSLFLLVLISFIALFAANKAVSQDTTSFTVDTFPSSPTNLIYQGDALVPPDSTSLRLTKTNATGYPTTYSIGRVLYSSPVKFWDAGRQASFETTVRFTITPSDDNPGDGIAFFISPFGSPIPSGSTGANLGIFEPSGNSSSLFAVRFNTYRSRYIGIDVNTRGSGNAKSFNSVLGQEVTARINYEATTRAITVVATAGSENVTDSAEFDLKTVLPGQVQVGISAATGAAVQVSDVRSWYFTSTMVSDPNSIQQYV